MRLPPRRWRPTTRFINSGVLIGSDLIRVAHFLCHLVVWSDAQWDALAPAHRPLKGLRVEGLGWIGAVPVVCLN